MKYLLARILCVTVALASASTAGALDLSKDRMWHHETTNDPFNGSRDVVYGLAFVDDHNASGLLALRRDGDAVMLSLTDVSNFLCPDAEVSDIRVSAWFSDTKRVITQTWYVADDRLQVGTYGWDGNEIFRNMAGSTKTIFRIEDGCGDVEDYWTAATNIAEEWSKMK